jgi:hypothetical protein
MFYWSFWPKVPIFPWVLISWDGSLRSSCQSHCFRWGTRAAREVKATDMFKHSQYRIVWSNFLRLWPKESPKQNRRGEEKQYHILSRGLCLTRNTLTKGQDIFWGLWIRTVALPDILMTSCWLWEWASSWSFCCRPKGIKLGEYQESPIELALASNTADRVSGGFPREVCGPCLYLGWKWVRTG